jgi:hypothetical protein
VAISSFHALRLLRCARNDISTEDACPARLNAYRGKVSIYLRAGWRLARLCHCDGQGTKQSPLSGGRLSGVASRDSRDFGPRNEGWEETSLHVAHCSRQHRVSSNALIFLTFSLFMCYTRPTGKISHGVGPNRLKQVF